MIGVGPPAEFAEPEEADKETEGGYFAAHDGYPRVCVSFLAGDRLAIGSKA